MPILTIWLATVVDALTHRVNVVVVFARVPDAQRRSRNLFCPSRPLISLPHSSYRSSFTQRKRESVTLLSTWPCTPRVSSASYSVTSDLVEFSQPATPTRKMRIGDNRSRPRKTIGGMPRLFVSRRFCDFSWTRVTLRIHTTFVDSRFSAERKKMVLTVFLLFRSFFFSK